jgi:hypothetical protein
MIVPWVGEVIVVDGVRFHDEAVKTCETKGDDNSIDLLLALPDPGSRETELRVAYDTLSSVPPTAVSGRIPVSLIGFKLDSFVP